MINENGGRAMLGFDGQIVKVQSMADGGWRMTVDGGQDSLAVAAVLMAIATTPDSLCRITVNELMPGSRLDDALDAAEPGEHGVWDDPGVYALDGAFDPDDGTVYGDR